MQKQKSKNGIRIITTSLFILIISPLYSICQEHHFTLKVNANNLSIKTLSISEAYYFKFKPYFAAKIKIDSSNVDKNSFTFEGTILYPTAVRLYPPHSVYFNKLIFIDTGYQEISIVKKDSSYSINSKTAIEDEHRAFLTALDINTIDDKMNGEKLFSYIEKHPDSYVGLFALINQTFNYGYLPVFDKIKNAFSAKINRTEAFQYYARLYKPNKRLENYIVYTSKKQPTQLNFENTRNRYTLLDFWALGCEPCLVGMEKMKQKYSKELKKKLDLITVNINQQDYFENGLKYIKEKEFPWKNYWDWDSNNIVKYVFFSYIPYNLLIDSSGKIIGENVDFNTINRFLK
jgi:thiol-disulfide isomerase/thioredoxin